MTRKHEYTLQGGSPIDLKMLYDIVPPWNWPKDAGKMFQEILDNRTADLSDRLLAAEMAGNLVVFNDALARTLLSIVGNSDEPIELRARATISFGSAFEHADLYEFEDPDDIILSEDIFREVQASFKKFYYDAGFPKEVRRRILEVVARVPLEWHSAAVRAAFASGDAKWQCTAVFCMQFIQGFDQQILEALESDDPDIRYEALLAVSNWGLTEAWPSIARLFSDLGVDKTMLLAAIDAAANIDLPEAVHSLGMLLNSDDDDIIDAVHEALAMLEGDEFNDEYDEQDDL
jgi:hypothetical protein